MLIFEEHFVSGSICEFFAFSLFSKVYSLMKRTEGIVHCLSIKTDILLNIFKTPKPITLTYGAS